MPILQWLFKSITNSSRRAKFSDNDDDDDDDDDDNVIIDDTQKSRELVITCGRDREEAEASFAIFLSTLQLKHLHSLALGPMGRMTEPVAVGCKVLPVCDAAASPGSRGSEGVDKDVRKRRKAISRMKELVKWAAAAKAGGKAGIKARKVLYFRNKMALKDSSLDDASSSSSKLSFRWDVGSCSASSSVFSPLSMPSASRSDLMWSKNLCTPPPAAALQTSSSDAGELLDCLKTEDCRRGGQWITSDSDFVVLEL